MTATTTKLNTIRDGATMTVLDALKSPGFYTVRMTPSDAAWLLADHNSGNRRLRSQKVSDHADMIRRGGWRSDHPNPIMLFVSGTEQLRDLLVMDGQHRLAGIVEAGTSVVMRVMVTRDQSIREHLDNGIVRQLADRVRFVDDEKLNAIIAAIIRFEAHQFCSVSHTSPAEANSLFEAHSESLMYAAQLRLDVYNNRNQTPVVRVPIVTALAEMHSMNAAKAAEFGRELVTSATTMREAALLREFALGSKLMSGYRDSLLNYAKAVSAMQATMDRRTLQLLKPMNMWRAECPLRMTVRKLIARVRPTKEKKP